MDFFEQLDDDSREVKCNQCQMIICRGGQGKTANTTSMNNHIKYRHPTLIPQLGSTNGHIPIGEMIALDNQPFVNC